MLRTHMHRETVQLSKSCQGAVRSRGSVSVPFLLILTTQSKIANI